MSEQNSCDLGDGAVMSSNVELTGAGTASALSAGLGVANCKHCGSKDYTIQLLHVGFRQRILVVECRECRYDLIPVVLDYFMPEAECYTKCREAWNAANETPNVEFSGTPAALYLDYGEMA